MFIYRDESTTTRKTPKPEDQGIAEIIIGKQRNGPTGTVKLAFLKEYTRFENLAHGALRVKSTCQGRRQKGEGRPSAFALA